MQTPRIFFYLLILMISALLSASPAQALEVTVKVSSVHVDFGMPSAPENLLDNDVSTAWIGGGIGPGTGQWIDLLFDEPVRIVQIGIFNGHQGEGKFKEFRRIRSGRVVYPDGIETAFWLRDESGEQKVQCRGKLFKSLRIIVNDVFPKGQFTAKTKLAVSEIKLYQSLEAVPDGYGEEAMSNATRTSSPPPPGPDEIVPDAIIALLREFYVRQTTLDRDYALLFAEHVRDRNDFRFEVFKAVQRQQGTYDILQTAVVDTSGLGFELVRLDGGLAEVRVFGSYGVKVANLDTHMEEDSTFVVTKEADDWKIVELDGEEELFK